MEEEQCRLAADRSGLTEFCRTKDFLVCVDSDGCVMNTMESKHKKCFGPCLVEEWGLEHIRDAVLQRWNEINLYTVTRGVNRFVGLTKMLREVNEEYVSVAGLPALEDWVGTTPQLSEEALAVAAGSGAKILSKALAWSRKVNERVARLSAEDRQPFSAVYASLEKTHEYADIAVVSSANEEAVREEFEESGLLGHVDLLLTQTVGTKEYCLKALLKKGYASSAVIMIGDARGDLKAAEKNGVLFYPVLVKKEEESWRQWSEEALLSFLNHNYSGSDQDERIEAFYRNLGM